VFRVKIMKRVSLLTPSSGMRTPAAFGSVTTTLCPAATMLEAVKVRRCVLRVQGLGSSCFYFQTGTVGEKVVRTLEKAVREALWVAV